ncbi:MAG: sugar phosphate isomerase/epimerase [Candidatus Schekmanbacteria bacterium]|nr:sugar phosphate isomerase/epimerase [Candidatus Schekmanbacteria bacterium]
MKIALSTHVCLEQPLSKPLLQQIKSAGFGNLELWGMRPHFNHQQAIEIGKILHEEGLNVVAVHAPFYTHVDRLRAGERLSLAAPDPLARQIALQETYQVTDALPALNCPLLIVHPGGLNDADSAERKNLLKMSLLSLLEYAKDLNLKIALENIPSPLGNPENVYNLVEEINNPNLGLCLDLGHGNLSGNLPGLIRKYADKLFHIHASDNSGCKDQHLVPGEGNINWPLINTRLSEIGYSNFLSWEIRYTEIWPDVLGKIYDKSGEIFPAF